MLSICYFLFNLTEVQYFITKNITYRIGITMVEIYIYIYIYISKPVKVKAVQWTGNNVVY